VLLPSRLQLPQPSTLPAAATAAAAAVQQRFEVVYFQVQAVSPASLEPLAVNPAVTQLVLQGGSARVLLPVGFKGYAVAAAAARANKQQAAIPSSSSSSSTTSTAMQVLQHVKQPLLLGVHASAAYQPAPGLPGVSGPLTDNWRQVGQLLAPLLHPSSAAVELSCSLLLWGPRGSGRRTAARAAAAALGMHVIEWSCHDLRVSKSAVLCWLGSFNCILAWCASLGQPGQASLSRFAMPLLVMRACIC
jgi:hypothetical protein